MRSREDSKDLQMRIPPAVVLFFLSPAIAELLSGSAPPSEFFDPFGFFLLASLYGSGALISRELKIRWSKGYVSMFIQGAAYGVIEEGLMVKSFFDPDWMDLGILGSYGRWQGVNWVWAEWLTIYHAVFSIAIPITLVELAYVERRNRSWLGKKTFIGLVALLGVVAVFGYFALTALRPPPIHYGLAAATVIILVVSARKVSIRTGKKGKLRPPKPSRLALAGFLTALSLFLLFWVGPHTVPEPIALMLLGVALVFTIGSFLKRYRWNEETLYHKFALTAGAVGFLIALTPLQEFDKSRPDNPQGMLIVGITASILLLLLARKARNDAVRLER